jgi:hypothetical protein
MMDLLQFGYVGAPPLIEYRQRGAGVLVVSYRSTLAPIANPYDVRINTMATRESVSWDLFKTVVTLLLAAISALLLFYLSGVREDINTLRSDLSGNATGIRRELSDARVEFTRAIGNVEKEVVTTNGKLDATNAKLDSIVLELQRPRPSR